MSPVEEWAACQRVGGGAHQLNLHGVIAPAASGLGETLAVFELHLPPAEQPVLVDDEDWLRLPADPRALLTVEPQPDDVQEPTTDGGMS
jgi:hypothetical protein